MVKGGMLKDDADWAKLGIKPGQKLMMMGSAGGQCIAARYPDTNNAASGPHVQAPSVQRGAPCHSLSLLYAVCSWAWVHSHAVRAASRLP